MDDHLNQAGAIMKKLLEQVSEISDLNDEVRSNLPTFEETGFVFEFTFTHLPAFQVTTKEQGYRVPAEIWLLGGNKFQVHEKGAFVDRIDEILDILNNHYGVKP